MGILSGLLDIPGWFKSDAQSALDAIPGYQKDIGRQGAAQAGTINNLMFGGEGNNVATMMANRANNGYEQLGPSRESRDAYDAARLASSGQLGTAIGSDASAAANLAKFGAQDIAGAGRANQIGQGMALDAQRAAQQTAGADLGAVRRTAFGQGPSAAQNLAQSQLDAGIRSQAAMAAGARGGNLAAAQRAAANAGSQMQLQAIPQLAAQRAQEQLNAQNTLAQGNANLMQGAGNITSQVGAMRGQDIQQATARANALAQAGGLASQNAGIQSQLAAQGIAQQGAGADRLNAQRATQIQAQENAKNEYANWLQRQYSISSGLPAGQYNASAALGGASAASQTNTQGAALGAIATYAASDRRAKKNIRETKLEELLGPLKAYDYDYKDPKETGASAGRKTSVMAQDLQKSDVGRSLTETKNDRGHTMVDYGKAAPVMLAAIAMLNRKISDVASHKASDGPAPKRAA